MLMKINFFGKEFFNYKVEKKNSMLKPVEPVPKIEPLKQTDRDTVTFSQDGMLMNTKNLLTRRINVTLNVCSEIVDKYETLDELEKYDYSGNIFMVKEFQARLETFLSLLEKRTSKSGLEDLFEQIELYFYKIDLNLPRIFEEISAATSKNKKGLI